MSSLKPIGETSTGAAAKPPKAKRYTIIRLAEIGGLKAKEKPTFTNEQMQRGATFNINDFDPDSAGEGALTDFERNIYNKLAPIAREGGKIGIHELYTVIEQTAKAEKEASFFSRLFIASLVLVAMVRSPRAHPPPRRPSPAHPLESRKSHAARPRPPQLIGVNAGITGALISSYKDTYARGSVIANGDGLVMRTTPATTPLPMLAAPVLRSEQLQAVEFLTVKVADAEHNTTRKTTYRVGAVHHYNGTMITFATEVAGHEVRVWNGEAYLMANGDRFELCENDVGCSAFQVDDAVSADRILNLAIEELVAAGYRAEGEALRRRRLQVRVSSPIQRPVPSCPHAYPLSPPHPRRVPPTPSPNSPPPSPPPSPTLSTPTTAAHLVAPLCLVATQTGIGECDVVEDQLAQLLNTPPSPPPPPLPSFWGGNAPPPPPSPPPPPPSPSPTPPPVRYSAVTWGEAGFSDQSALQFEYDDVIEVVANTFAFAAIKQDRTAIAWGADEGGGDIEAAERHLLTGVRKIAKTNSAFAAICEEGGRVVTWGKAKDGGDSSAIQPYLTDIEHVYANAVAFVAVNSLGMARASWGVADAGGTIPTAAAATLEEKSVTAIVSTLYAFAALHSDGTVTTWGWSEGGGEVPLATQPLLVDVVAISASANAFAARTASGAVVSWGDAEAGGDASLVAASLATCVASAVAATDYAFAALCADGAVVVWGDAVSGGSSSAAATALGGASAVEVVGNNQAFAAITAGGFAVAWGLGVYGGDASDAETRLNEIRPIVKVVPSEYAFAAIGQTGGAVSWGDPQSGGDWTNVAEALASDVVEIVASDAAFAALKADNSVVTWGDASAGGDASLVAATLANNDVQKIVAAGSAFTALRTFA